MALNRLFFINIREQNSEKSEILSFLCFQDYESDFQECTDSETSAISEKTDSGDSSHHLEPIELYSREQVLLSI